MAPLFIVIEGTDGAGTTTQGDLLAEALRAEGRRVVRTAQPSPGPIGQLLRTVLRDTSGQGADPVAVALLFAADRVDHLQRVVEPALREGAVVVCDRYVGSSLAFQVVDGAGRIDAGWLLEINRGARVPDLSILLDVATETALARIEHRGQPHERFEVEATLRAVRERYLAVFAAPPRLLGAAAVVDASRPVAAVAVDVLAAVRRVG